MARKEVCNMDCANCIHPDCINDNPQSRQVRYYWRHREEVLRKKREAYRRKKEEQEK